MMIRNTHPLIASLLMALLCITFSGCRSKCYSLLLTAEDIEELATLLADKKDLSAFFSERNYQLNPIDTTEMRLSDGYPLPMRTDPTYSARLFSSSPECVPVFRVLRVSMDGYKDARFESVILVYRDEKPYFDQIEEILNLGYTSGPTLSMFNRSHQKYLDDRLGLILDHPRIKVRRMKLYRTEGKRPAVHLETWTMSKEPEANGNNTYFVAIRVWGTE